MERGEEEEEAERQPVEEEGAPLSERQAANAPMCRRSRPYGGLSVTSGIRSRLSSRPARFTRVSCWKPNHMTRECQDWMKYFFLQVIKELNITIIPDRRR